MPKIVLPFSSKEGESPKNEMSEEELLQLLPEPFQEVCKQNKHLLDYLRLIPIEVAGVPEYCTKLTRAQGDKQDRKSVVWERV